MKSALTFLVLSLLLTACGHHAPPEDNSPDGQLRKKLIGDWTMEKILDHAREMPNVASDGRVILAADGTFESRFTSRGSNYTHDFAYTGTWLITNGELRSVITSSSFPKAVSVGTTDRFKITRADSNELVWFAPEKAQTIYYKRTEGR